MEKCFFTDCKNEVNARVNFCEHHDKKEHEAAAEVAAIFAKDGSK